MFEEGREKRYPKDHEANCYVVITRTRDSESGPERAATKLNKDATPVWPEGGDLNKARVIVYVQKRTTKEHPWPGSAGQE